MREERPHNLAAVLKTCQMLAGSFWCGAHWRRAWMITAAALAFELTHVALQLALNRWNRSFFDALEAKSGDGIYAAGLWFVPLALMATASVVGAVLCKMLLQVRWREAVTALLRDRWLANRAFYRLNVLYGADVAPEHRFTEDARLTVEPVIDLSIGFLSAVLTFTVFVGVLWTVAGSMTIAGYPIPGFMVLAAIVYSLAVWLAMSWIGAPYTQQIRERSEAEARYRFELTRVRENAESIALVGGEPGERQRLDVHYDLVVSRWTRVSWQWAHMTWVAHGNALAAPVVPLLLMAPQYLNGQASLGIVMQTAAAFGIVQGAVGWFTGNYTQVAEWYASASRICDIDTMMLQAGEDSRGRFITLASSPDENLYLDAVSVDVFGGRTLVADAHVVIAPGEMVMVVGEAGTGKSSLVRAIAGLWPWGAGSILLPEGARVAFLPQRPYLPIGTLAAAVTYPQPATAVSRAEVVEVLTACGIGYLAPRADELDSWDKVLSGGEQQRLAFARLLITMPTIAILDEATAALDEASQSQLMELFRFRLAATTVISISHRPGLAKFHNRQIVLRKEINGARVSVGETIQTPLARMRRALTALNDA